MTIKGVWQNGLTSETEQAILECDDNGLLRVQLTQTKPSSTGATHTNDAPKSQVIQSHISKIKISERIGQVSRRLTFPMQGQQNAMFVTQDNDAVDALISLHKQEKWYGKVYLLESNLSIALISLLVTLAVVMSCLFYAMPYAAEKIAFRLPASVLNKTSDLTIKTLDKAYFSKSKLSAARQQQLQNYFTEFGPHVNSIQFRQGGKHIKANAFALPSGVIIFTDELINLATNDQQLLAIYYHEAGHIQRRHSIRSVLQASSMLIMAVFIAGDASGFMEVAYALPTFLVQSSYSRKFEKEADDYAYELMQKNKIPLHHFADILTMLSNHNGQTAAAEDKGETSQDNSPLSEYLSSHPATSERIKRFKKNAKQK